MGALNVAVSTSVSNWFVRQRGRALGIAMAGNAVGVVFLVPVAQWIITTVGWRSAWLILGGGTGLLLAVSAAVFLRHKPEDMGLEPDGNPTEKAPDGRTIPDEPSWSVREASHSRSFWLLVIANAFGQAAISGLTIHQAALLESNGVSASIAALAVSAYGLTWAIGSIAWGRLAERFPSNSALAVSFAIVAVCAFGAPHIHWDALALAFYFGRRSVGGIRGLSRPFVIGASASGPVLGGLGYDFFKSYSTIVLLFSALAAIGAAAALVSRRPSTRH
jgi:predicted MFS family arabinose efflux permease